MKTGTMKTVGVVLMAVTMAAGMAMAKPGPKKELSGQVNINTATVAQLDLLPGIGEKAAKRIIELRAKAPFAKVEDLRKVKGIGAKKLEKLRPFVTLSGPTTATLKKSTGAEAATASPSAQGRRANPPGR